MERIEVDLEAILNGERPCDRENDALDFKLLKGDGAYRQLAQAAACFANASGGLIVVGVHDKRSGSAAFKGSDLDPSQVKAKIFALTQPGLLVSCDVLHFADARLLVVTVPEGVEICSDDQGVTKRRVGSECLPMSALDQHLAREGRGLVDDTAAISDLDVDAVRPRALAAARQALSDRGDQLSDLASVSDLDLLRALGVVSPDGRLLRAGEVLFCEPEPGSTVLLYQHRATPGGEATTVERMEEPLILVYEKAVELVWARRHTSPVDLPGGRQIEVADFPQLAVREVIANALLHRMYRLPGPVSVEHSPASLVVESPGPLVSGVDESNILTHPSKPRNRCLFEAARMLSIAEETGRGVDRMYRTMILAGHEPPVISQRSDATRVAFASGRPTTQIVAFLRSLPESEQVDLDTLLLVLAMLRSRTITAEQLAKTIQKSTTEAETVLRRHSDEVVSILEVTRESQQRRKRVYRLAPSALQALGSAVPYNRIAPREAEQKVITHVREYARVTNRTVRNLLDFDVHQASALLRTLCDSGLLVKTSHQQRGTAVEYGPGPAFPDA